MENLYPETFRYEVNAGDLALDNQRRIFIRNFISDIRNGTNHVAVALDDHKKTLMAINAAYDSIYNGEPIKIQY